MTVNAGDLVVNEEGSLNNFLIEPAVVWDESAVHVGGGDVAGV